MIAFFYLIILLIVALFFGGLCSRIANAKGHSGYGMQGFLLGPIRLIAVAALPDERQANYLLATAKKLNAELQETNSTGSCGGYWREIQEK